MCDHRQKIHQNNHTLVELHLNFEFLWAVVTVADDSQYATQLLIAAHLVRVPISASRSDRSGRFLSSSHHHRLFAPCHFRVPRGSRMRRCGPSACVPTKLENQRPPQTEPASGGTAYPREGGQVQFSPKIVNRSKETPDHKRNEHPVQRP
jgi:hypothetical protein